MKNRRFKITASLIALIGLFFLSACVKEDLEIEEMVNPELNQPNIFAHVGSELIQDTMVLEFRGSQTLIYSNTFTLSKNGWKGLRLKKSSMGSYKYTAQITRVYGDPSLITFGYTPNSSSRWRRIRTASNGTTETTYVQASDLKSSETYAYFYVNALSNCKYQIKVYRESTGSGNTGNSNLTIRGYGVSPPRGIVSRTSFTFKTKVTTNSNRNLNVKIELIAPDGSRNPFSMYKSGSYYKFNRVLSQIGTYKYRYVVTQNGSTKRTSYYSMSVRGCATLNAPFYAQPTGSAECGQHCVKMALDYFGRNYSIQQIKTAMGKTSWSNANDQAKGFNALTRSRYEAKVGFNWDLNRLRNEICAGRPVFVNVQLGMTPSNRSSRNHVMLLTGITNDKVYVNDSWLSNGRNKSYPLNDFISCWTKASKTVVYFK